MHEASQYRTLLPRPEPALPKIAFCRSQLLSRSLDGDELQSRILCNGQRPLLGDTAAADRESHHVARPPALDRLECMGVKKRPESGCGKGTAIRRPSGSGASLLRRVSRRGFLGDDEPACLGTEQG